MSSSNKKRREPVAVGQQIWEVLSYHAPKEVVHCARIQIGWLEVVQEPWTQHTWPASLQRGKLAVHVRDHQWLHEAAYFHGQWLERLRLLFPQISIAQLVLRVAELPALAHGAKSAASPDDLRRAHFWVTLPKEPAASTQRALLDVENTELRLLLATLRLALSQR